MTINLENREDQEKCVMKHKDSLVQNTSRHWLSSYNEQGMTSASLDPNKYNVGANRSVPVMAFLSRFFADFPEYDFRELAFLHELSTRSHIFCKEAMVVPEEHKSGM